MGTPCLRSVRRVSSHDAVAAGWSGWRQPPLIGLTWLIAFSALVACPDGRGIVAQQPGDAARRDVPTVGDGAGFEDAVRVDAFGRDTQSAQDGATADASAPDAASPDTATAPDQTSAPDTASGPDTASAADTGSADTASADDAAAADSAPEPCSAGTCTDPHRGTCVRDGGVPVCLCDPEYADYGDGVCRPQAPCSPNPCTDPHRAVCQNQLGVALCLCDPGYVDPGSGSCQPAVGCDPNPCAIAHRSLCAVVGNQVVCACDDGYVDDGNGGCVASSGSACDPNPCQTALRTRCSLVNQAAVCLCDLGYEEDGLGGCGAAVSDPCLSSSCGTAVSGRVTHGGAPLPNVVVNAYDGACPLSGFVSSTFTDGDGYYVLSGLSASAALYLRVGTGADARWYNAAGGSSVCLAREGVAVVDGQTTTGVDVTYPAGGAIGGRITASGTGVGPGLQVQFSRQLCGGGLVSVEVLTDADGNYLARGLPEGAYYVEACPSCRAGFETYADRWWNTASGSSDCAAASTVTVLAHTLTPAIDLALEPPASIAGTITLDGSPVSGVLVHAYDGPCASGHYSGGAFSISDGTYHLPELPAGTFYLETRMRSLASPRYADAWWTSGGGSVDCSQAEGTAVASGASVGGRDFALLRGGSVSGRVTEASAGVAGLYVWAHVSDCARSDERAWFQPALTDASGDYRIVALPEGDVRIYVSAQEAHPGLLGWYDGSTGVASCASSTTVHVTDAADSAGVDLAF